MVEKVRTAQSLPFGRDYGQKLIIVKFVMVKIDQNLIVKIKQSKFDCQFDYGKKIPRLAAHDV